MTLLVFGFTRTIPPVFLFMIFSAAAAAFLAAFLFLFQGVNEHASPDFLIRSWGARFWGTVSSAGLATFLWKAGAPFYPVTELGARIWPAPLGLWDYARHAGLLSLWGAFAFWACAREGLSGRLEGWTSLRFSPAWPRLWGAGALAGLGLAVAGSYAHHWLFLGRALRQAGYPFSAYAAVGAELILLPVFAVFSLWCLLPPSQSESRAAAASDMPALPSEGLTGSERAGLAAVLLAAMALPAHGMQAYLRSAWDFGSGDLGRAAGVPWGELAPSRDVLILARKDGSPGSQAETLRAAAAGVEVTPESLEKIRDYLERRSFRSLYAREAAAALRQGWALWWDLDRYLDAAALHGRHIEPDYEGFLRAIRGAPITMENYERLSRLAEYAATRKFIRVDQSQKIYEGFSAAYAHFGEQKESNLWLDKVSGLLPLLTEEIKIDPLETAADCAIVGAVKPGDFPPGAVRVGLFLERSTSAALGAATGLVDSVVPDDSGEFGFDHLTPGRYYLALQADSGLGLARKKALAAPGILRVSAEAPELRLPVISLGE